ncbi:meiosis inhibitor protein 1 isoform X1 [Corythoichthys intestinalis]|uniref:meiosis inhibitor protein 1 isoform X1 n=3 Tax=Corythoichthys intestinalis TaxID=161448 RepID=UPI0025A5CF10|nr:meiosis inhibitor protein 1 isoform X1 [Corythoichthys intestinalis]XP_057673226.1 meiosis inhibitor protein 1 isoform X1 [Corythoichthys intestinalis]
MKKMASKDIINDKFHFRHDPSWSGRLGPAKGGGLHLCIACVIEMLESDDISLVRKSHALSAVCGFLKCFPGALREMLQNDHQVSMHFISSLMGMLHILVDPATLEKVDQVLVLLLLELRSEMPLLYVLDQINKQMIDQLNVKSFLPTFNFLGSLVEAIPSVALTLVTHFVPLLDRLCSVLLYPDEEVKASVVYMWLKLLGTTGGSAAQSLPVTVRDRVCTLLIQTFANASHPQLINNCIALLWLLVQWGEAVSVLMSNAADQLMCSQDQNIHISTSQNSSQNQEEQIPDHCHLPLILKKLLLSGDDTLQVTSAKCIASILIHSPIQYSAPFIKAGIPEFLFDRLANTSSEVLLWSVYSCLVLLIEDPIFSSQCHSVYGIESLVSSLKRAEQLTNVDVLKQGLLLLTKILERESTNVRLFLSPPAFVAVSQAVICGLSSPCLQVATQGSSAAAGLFRLNHQSRPVQYQDLQGLLRAITRRFSELQIPRSNSLQSRVSLEKSQHSSLFSLSEGFLLQSLLCFQAACRLAVECASDPVLKENTFTAPTKKSNGPDSLESLCQCMLQCCDSVWIPTVVRMCECAPNPQILQVFYSILSSQFTLLPSVTTAFANKMASSGFYKLALEHKGIFCVGNRNTPLNAACCDFLQKLSMCLFRQSFSAPGIYQQDAEEIENLLQYSLSSLCCRLSDWPTLLCESPGLQLCDYKGPRATQYCLVIILHLALQQGDRLLPDQTVFSSVVWFLRSVQEEGSCTLPTFVLRSSLYLLAVTQDKSPALEGASLDCIDKALSSSQSFSSLYIHHSALLHFICGNLLLKEKFGALVLELWLNKQAQSTDADVTMTERHVNEKRCAEDGREQEHSAEIVELLSLLKKYPSVIMILLDIVCNKEASLAERALAILTTLLDGQSNFEEDLCTSLKPALLQALQKLSVERMGFVYGQKHVEEVNSLPLVLRLLCVTHAASNPPSTPCSNMDEVHFKLLYQVSNIAGRLNQSDTESLLPALSYLYCYLSRSPSHCTDRAVPMLLSNCGLMNQLQTILSSSSSSAPFVLSSDASSSSLLCCSHLLLSSLITLQHELSIQVHKILSWSLETAVQRMVIQKRNTDTILLVSYLRLLQALLSVDLNSALVCVTTGPGLVGQTPLEVEDGALFPLGSKGAQCLLIALSGLILQKNELLLRASVNCLSSVLGFLQRKYPQTANYVVSQPWSRFLLYSLHCSGKSFLLHPAILRVITLVRCYTRLTSSTQASFMEFMRHGSQVVLWEHHLLQVMDAVEKNGVKKLSQEASQALRLLLTQMQSCVFQPPPTEEHKQRVKRVMESLDTLPPFESLPCDILYPEFQMKISNMLGVFPSVCLTSP